MPLLARYLQAVKFWLPRDQQEDIAAELQEDIESRIEEQEGSLGRRLSNDEMTKLLKDYGRPVTVANRYGKQEQLIGPTLFPVYRFVLKMVALFYLLPWLLILCSMNVFGHGSLRSVLAGLPSFWTVTSTTLGIVTIVFAVFERLPSTSIFLNHWDPGKLPPLRDPRHIKKSSSIAQIIAGIVVMLWWLNGWFTETLLQTSGIRLTVTATWQKISWGVMLVLTASIALACVNLIRPSWTRTRIYLRLMLDCCGAFLFCWLLKAQVLSRISAPQLGEIKASAAVNAMNAGMASLVPYFVVACLLMIALNNGSRPAWGLALYSSRRSSENTCGSAPGRVLTANMQAVLKGACSRMDANARGQISSDRSGCS